MEEGIKIIEEMIECLRAGMFDPNGVAHRLEVAVKKIREAEGKEALTA